MSRYHIVLCTCPDNTVAQQIAATLVEEKLAACVNLLPGVVSVYQWQGELCRDTEVQMIIKTTSGKLDAAFERMLSLHPYDVPEWLVLDPTTGNPDYLNWIKSSLT